MQYPHPGGDLAPAYVSGSTTRVEVEPAKGTKLAANTTYLFMGKNAEQMLSGFCLKWDNAIIITAATIEDTGMSEAIVPNTDITAGNGWVTEVPPSFPVSPGGAGTVTTGSLAVAGGTAGAAIAHLPNLGSSRCRLKVVVGATGGYLAVAPHGKA